MRLSNRVVLAVALTLFLAITLPTSVASTTGSPCSGCPVVQPGSRIEVAGVLCSAGFLLRGRDGDRLLSTPGHCVFGVGMGTTRSGDRTWPVGKGPEVRLTAGGEVIGRVVYATHVPDESDFAVVRIQAGVATDPSTVAGDPVTRSSAVRIGDRVSLVGQGVGAGAVLPKRDGLVSGTAQPHGFTVALPAVPGDSGGPVTTAGGGALGLVIRGGGFLTPDPGTAQVIRLPVMLNRVRQELRWSVTLWTSS